MDLKQLGAAFVGMLAIVAAKAATVVGDLPLLQPETDQLTACKRTQNILTRAHYRIVSLDDLFADRVTERLLYFLDYNHSLLTQTEIQNVAVQRPRLMRAVHYCDLSYPYELYELTRNRRAEKYQFFLDSLNRPIELESKKTALLDRHELPYPATRAELETLWSNEFVNEYLTLLLADKTPAQARERIEKRYRSALNNLRQVTDEEVFSLYENAFSTAIDPHTNYLSPQDSENFEDNLNLSLEGIGAVLSSEDDYTVIVSIIPGSPAEASKQLKAKDKIVGIRQEDGSYDDIIGWRLQDVVRKIKGHKGTAVTLDIERDEAGSTAAFSVNLIRNKIRLQDNEAKGTVKTSADGQKVGVITIKSFYNGLHDDVKRELDKLQARQVAAIVIDLRNNGGGLLPEAVLTTGLFVKDGPIVQVRDAMADIEPQLDTDAKMYYDGPVVVLINRISASSSEIMAAALRDYGRAVLVGDTTFGKGTVQRSLPLERMYDNADQNLGSVNFTIAKFYRITGGSTQLKGVEPDIPLITLVDNAEIGERTEPNALAWDQVAPVPYQRYADLQTLIPTLRDLSSRRVTASPAFEIFRESMRRYYQQKNAPELSLNYTKRRQQQDEQTTYSLNTINQRLHLMGKPPIKALTDLPVDFEFDDPLLDEGVNIAADFAARQTLSQVALAQP